MTSNLLLLLACASDSKEDTAVGTKTETATTEMDKVLTSLEEVRDTVHGLEASLEAAEERIAELEDNPVTGLEFDSWTADCSWGEEFTTTVPVDSVFNLELYFPDLEAWQQSASAIYRTDNEVTFFCGTTLDDYGPTQYRAAWVAYP